MKTVTFQGNPLHLTGRNLKVGAPAPFFRVTGQDLKEVTPADFSARIKIITSFPSLDTPVCDLQVKEFNKRAAGLSADTVILAVSMDLPFAQARFCDAFGVKNITVLSDYRNASFGINYGLLVKELNLLARAVVILDHDVVSYVQIAPELTKPLDYDDALKNLQEILENPVPGTSSRDTVLKCTPCEGTAAPLSHESVAEHLALLTAWQLTPDQKITREFKFKDFTQAKYFFDLIAAIAQEEGHHPELDINYNKLKVILTTHAVHGLTENDFTMAEIIEELNG
jgi:thiol peroxidase